MHQQHFTRTVFIAVVVCVLSTLFFTICFTDKGSAARVPQLCTILPSSVQFLEDLGPQFTGQSRLCWPKHSMLNVYFYDGDPTIQDEVISTASEWSAISGIKFTQVYSDTAQIRISFNCAGYNSYIGTQSLDSAFLSGPTMCLQGLDTLQDKEEVRRTILHEFGHVMGLLHELQNPTASIPWDTARLFAYYKKTYNWDRDSVTKWVLRLYDNVDFSQFDRTSIMIYAVPAEVTKGSCCPIPWPRAISSKDKKFITENYQ